MFQGPLQYIKDVMLLSDLTFNTHRVAFAFEITTYSESKNKRHYVSYGATAAVLVFGFCCSPLFRGLVKTGLIAGYFVKADRSSVPGNPAHSWAFLGNDCEPAAGCDPQLDRAWNY